MKTFLHRSVLALSTASPFALSVALLAFNTHAAVFNIPNGDVAGLVAAINTANGSIDADSINLATAGTYTLTTADNTGSYGATGLPVITSPVTINGNGATIQRSSAPGAPEFRIFLVGSGPAQLTLNSLTIRGGKSPVDVWGGGGLLNTGSTRLENVTVTGNSGGLGGGIFNHHGTLTVLNSTISYNSSFGGFGGGGILSISGPTVTIVNSTLFENRADAPAGFQGRGDAIADAFSPLGSIVVKNSILASPTLGLGNDLYIAGGVVTSLGHNIVGDNSGALAFTGPGDLGNIDPMLGPLADNGGPTWTHAPLLGSPATDAVPLADCTDTNGVSIATDQRGIVRPQGAACDIGSVELLVTQVGSVTYQSGDFTGLAPALGGSAVNSSQYMGWRFTLPSAATVTGFGASLYLNGGFGTLFGAITSLPDLSSFPASPATFVPLVSAVVSPPVGYTGGSLTTAALSIDLPAGTYALIFGGGRFGAGNTPTGGIANIGSVPYFVNEMLVGSTATDSWTNFTNGNYYFVTVEPLAAPTFEVIKHFADFTFNPNDGYTPRDGVIQDSAGALYGTTRAGGNSDLGTVFKLAPNGSGGYIHTELKSFNGADGIHPLASVIQDGAGVLYGTTETGGSSNQGTVFKLTPDVAGGYIHTKLKDFNGVNGSRLSARLVQDGAGALYGASYTGGSNDGGTVFKLTPALGGGFTHTILKSFAFMEGRLPFREVIQDSAGTLYGTTVGGGSNTDLGTVFKLTPNGSGGYDHSVLKAFDWIEGAFPYAGLVQDGVGALYGTTSGGGSADFGTAFKLTPDGLGGYSYEVLKHFTWIEGAYPFSNLIRDSAGALYGVTQEGGIADVGTVFKLTPNGSGGFSHRVLKHLNGIDGAYPYGGLVLGHDGALYGTASEGGKFGGGTVFRIVLPQPADISPPVLSGVPANIIAEATGPTGAIVSYSTPTANDLVDGARPVACVPPPGSTFPLGVTTVTCTASDTQGNTASASFNVTVRDTTLPNTTISSATDGNGSPVVVAGSTLSGSITLSFAGTDAVGAVGFECSLNGAPYSPNASPMSYSGLAVGGHTFAVRAYDAAGNRDASPASFSWSIITPTQAVQNLNTTINGMGLPKGVANNLTAPLNNLNPANLGAACGKVGEFIKQVNDARMNGKLSATQASQLLQSAAAIKAALGC